MLPVLKYSLPRPGNQSAFNQCHNAVINLEKKLAIGEYCAYGFPHLTSYIFLMGKLTF